ncbi:hypothetical protein N9C84_03970 [Desulfobacterales bacterium]|nr:hypothetical protein [Desulfobacterales bacterium]
MKKIKKTENQIRYEKFISLPQGEGAVQMLENLMGDHPEYEELVDWLLIACFNAKRFQDSDKGSSDKRRHKDKDAVQEIRGKGSNQIKAIDKLRGFIEHYPQAADAAMVSAIGSLRIDGVYLSTQLQTEKTSSRRQLPTFPAHLVMSRILFAYREGLKSYEPPKNLHHWYHRGCILTKEPIEQKVKNPAIDCLIFEMTYHIRRYLYDKPRAIDYGMPLPEGKGQPKGINKVIAEFVNAVLTPRDPYGKKEVKTRVDSLRNQKAVLVPWDI